MLRLAQRIFQWGHSERVGIGLIQREYNWLQVGKKGSPYSITDSRVPELIPVLGSQLQVV